MKKTVRSIVIILAVTALSAAAYPPPEKGKMTLSELERSKFDFDGKVVEIEVISASNIEQISPDKYSARCFFHSGQDTHNISYGSIIYFLKDEDGETLEFLEKLEQVPPGSTLNRTSFYVLVEGQTLTAIGDRYKKSKNTYTW